jgi:hypothetical protein
MLPRNATYKPSFQSSIPAARNALAAMSLLSVMVAGEQTPRDRAIEVRRAGLSRLLDVSGILLSV